MKKLFVLSIISLMMISVNFGQKPSIDLSFTSVNDTAWIQMDSIRLVNRTLGGDTVLYYPDTVLSVNYVGISEISNKMKGFQVFQNYPNPVTNQTKITMFVPEKDNISVIVADMLGRIILKSSRTLDKGMHAFRFTPGGGNLYFFTAQWRGNNSSIKILQAGGNPGGSKSLEYIGGEYTSPQTMIKKTIQGFVFNPGDELLYIGYAGGLQSGFLDKPEESHAYAFQFATNIPCPGTPLVEYEGKVYNTIQIFSQCWLKENLNVGIMINGMVEMTDNGIIEKYCYYNDTNRCNQYGGLYQWDEMMTYSTQSGAQGICPPDWHLPSDEEWKVLEGAVDSLYEIGDPIWNLYGLRGFNAGTNLKSTTGWSGIGNGSGLFMFAGLPGGYRYSDGYFYYTNLHALWWSSTDGNATSAWNRYLSYNNPIVDRDFGNNKGFGFSVRCIKD